MFLKFMPALIFNLKKIQFRQVPQNPENVMNVKTNPFR